MGAGVNREHLPNRRPSVIRPVEWAGPDGQPFECAVGIGFHLDGRVAEVFASDLKIGSAMRTLLEDACVITSIALQSGVAPEALGRSLGRVPVLESEDAPASIIGAIVAVLVGENRAGGEVKACGGTPSV
jgi:hypothetical protein